MINVGASTDAIVIPLQPRIRSTITGVSHGNPSLFSSKH